jgi:hypothetical protein
MSYELVRAEGFSPLKIIQTFDFYHTVRVDTRVVRGLSVDVYRAAFNSLEEAEDWIEKYSLKTHTRWNKLYGKPKQQ